MKKVTFLLALAIMLAIFCLIGMTGCTQNMRTRTFGGSQEISLPKGQRLVMLTWKKDDLWILTEPMDSDYVPKTKICYESSNYQIYEGTITVVESK